MPISITPASLRAIAPTRAERAVARPGDAIVPAPDVVMDRACDLPAPSDAVFPWLLQLGKGRGGWYLPRTVEALMPPSRRALRTVDPALARLAVGDTIPDWGGADATFEVAVVEPPYALVHRSTRGAVQLTWDLHLTDQPVDGRPGSRLHLRLRLGGVRHWRLAEVGGGAFDAITVAGLAAGLRERLR